MRPFNLTQRVNIHLIPKMEFVHAWEHILGRDNSQEPWHKAAWSGCPEYAYMGRVLYFTPDTCDIQRPFRLDGLEDPFYIHDEVESPSDGRTKYPVKDECIALLPLEYKIIVHPAFGEEITCDYVHILRQHEISDNLQMFQEQTRAFFDHLTGVRG
ncbi:MAG: hypothetical protein KJ709_04490 [Nanoarchaeota archaeon]|nr:hypothetical protein [Nanoarchaeota archaeon]